MTTDPSASTSASAASGPAPELAAEDSKLLVLARSARLRAYVPDGRPAQGAALRDTTGRTYAAATVGHTRGDLALSALRAAVAAAVSSGARSFEAAAVVTGDPQQSALSIAADDPTVADPTVGAGGVAGITADDLAMLAEFGTGVPVFVAGPDGALRARTTS
ncbi:cytidine deaminase [Frankia sp. AiPa1]|uniref:cytidine deaminase n=1 Tax=Frankia sp. AiPa1 TaxID=573492 RepID=UPI00202AD86A|nr:cytidine deaminase [Frankia sp. AiPa1]MCL9761736.1 cytidine deaminase [Frankia sp. AiPa1]